MKMTTRIAYENMKYHKSKNILIGIAVFLTTLLLFLVPAIGTNIIDGQIAAINESYPTWHALLRNVDKETVKKLSAYHGIAVYGLRSDAGNMVCENASITMMSMDKEGYSLYRLKLTEGEFPEKINEIVVSAGVLDEIGLKGKKLGDTITIPYQIFRNGGLDYTEKKDFVISGFVEDSNTNIENNVYSTFVSKKFIENEVPSDQIYYRFLFQVKGKRNTITEDVEQSIKNIANQFSIPERDILINEEYLMANYIDPTILPVIIGIMLIIMIAGIITIYSIYYVGMTERIQEFGKLKAIGATKIQIKQIVLKEGLVTSLFAIPIGLIVGSILSRVVFLGFLSFFGSNNSMIITMKELLNNNQFPLYHGWIYLLTILVATFTVCLSLLRPMKIAANISEMEAIRYQPDEAGLKVSKRKAIKKRNSFTNITIPKLSFIYLYGKKKNSLITIISMGVTGVFFMVVATVLTCANPRESANNSVFGQYEIGIKVETGNKEHPEREWDRVIQKNPLTDEFKERIMAIDGIKSVSNFSAVYVSADVFGDEINGICGVPKEYSDIVEKGIIEGKATYEDLKTGDKVIVEKNLLHWYPDIKIGDILTLKVKDGGENKQKKVEVIAIGDYSIGFTSYNYLLMADEEVKKLSNYNVSEVYHIFADQDYNKYVEKKLNKLITDTDQIKLQTWQERYTEWKSALAVINGACFAFLGVLGMICVMNMVNTMMNSIHLRKKEIGTLQAIGMTERQLVIMLLQEGLYYTIGTVILSVGLGSLLGYPVFLWAKYNGTFNISNYHYPILAAVTISVVLMLIQMGLAIILGRSVRKETIIERIRFSE